MDDDELREALASLAHQMWIHWMEYLFNACEPCDGRLTIPTDKHKRWRRQMATPYNMLPANEKQSDREQAGKFMELFERWRWALKDEKFD